MVFSGQMLFRELLCCEQLEMKWILFICSNRPYVELFRTEKNELIYTCRLKRIQV